jgi:elongation factor 3
MDSIKKQFEAATTSKTKADRVAGAEAFAAEVTKAGLPLAFHELKLTELLTQKMKVEGKKGGPEREGALYCTTELCKADKAAAVFLIPIISETFALQGDKLKPVATAASEAAEAIFKGLDENLVELLLPSLCKKVLANEGNESRFKQIAELCVLAPQQMSVNLTDLIPAAVEFVNHLKKPLAKSAAKALKALCNTCTNPDMEPFIPALVKCMKDIKEVPETVFKVASTTFVAEVDSSALAIMAPVLKKGLETKSATAVKRQAARIIENMAKLVDEPRHLHAFLPQILPLLESAAKHVSDPEARDVIGRAVSILTKKASEAMPLAFDMKVANETVNTLVAKITSVIKPEYATLLTMVAYQMKMLNEISDYDAANWKKSVAQTLVLAGFDQAKAESVAEEARLIAEKSREVKEEEEIDDGAEVLCDLPFGLAYGNKVLLRKTKLKLLRGYKYGLLGQNDSGKTSLLTALADYKIDGFPTAEECRTVFVATDVKTELADLPVINYMFEDPLLKDCGVSKEKMEVMLNSFGFKEGNPANTTQPVGTLSGGWRMKLALSRAMLLKADILLLDEPTNHLDAYNVKWVETYLNSLDNVTCIMVSHDSGLLTRVCNNIIEIDNMRLNYFKGNLEQFVAEKPEAKCYFELSEKGKVDFVFPNPGPLPGINSKGKAILKMSNITFTYPEPDGSYIMPDGSKKKAQLNNVSVQVSLSSRVACVGENGAGKSTMIKLLTGDLEPDEGSGDVWKHPNCRVGYIAQHAFHHIEKHLDETANDYIRWRYANGGDREETVKVTSICTAEEIEKQQKQFEFSMKTDDDTVVKRKLVVDRFTERRRDNKKDKTVEYELVFTTMTGNHWIERDQLCKAGWEKVLKTLDERIALRATQFARPLTKENVRKHLADVGLAPEFSTHMRIGSLSGGQKVKVVLAAALWLQPHILILDEPTNYLDRESLGALARAIRKFEGGVVMITHNSQFCDNLCPVVWHLQNNTLDVKGDAEWMAEAARAKIVVQKIDEGDMVDKFGNTIDIKKTKPKTKKQLKMKKLRRLKRFKETGDDYDSSEEDA